MSKKIVVRVAAGHPTGTRRRAGFLFTEAPSLVEVSDDQLEQITADKYLIIVEKGEALRQGLENPNSGINLDVPVDNNGDIIPSDDENQDPVITPVEDLTKSQIVELLIQKGKIEGEDFNKNAKKEVLIQILNS